MKLHHILTNDSVDPGSSSPTVGLLYSPGDLFGQKRIEMLVGPMSLENILPVRFTQEQIDPERTMIYGHWHIAGAWEPCPGVKPDSILDLTIPRQPRLPPEQSLLNSIPHTNRIDQDRFDLLTQLHSEPELHDFVLTSLPLSSHEDMIKAAELWGGIVLKPRQEESKEEPVLLELQQNGWRCTSFFDKTEMDQSGFIHWLMKYLNRNWMIQPFLKTSTAQGRSFALEVTVQQRHDGAWMVPAVHCLMANESPFACLDACAEYLGDPFSHLWDDIVFPSSLKNTISLRTLIQCFANILATRLASRFGPLTSALGFKILLDKNMIPRLANITVRPKAPAKPARNLDFFKHLSKLLRRLPVHYIPPPIFPLAVHKKSEVTTIPSFGISVRSPIPVESVPDIADCGTQWLDVALSRGGRYLLSVIDEKYELLSDTSPFFLSIRLGMAAHDYDIPGVFDKLNAVEEYVGRGLILWSEVNYMRSVRVPLLQVQLDLALQCLNMRCPDMVWIDDLDLGLRSLSKSQRMNELILTVEWLDALCNKGVIRWWGVQCFNAKKPDVLKWIEYIADSAARYRNFKAICLRLEHYSEQYAILANKHQLSMVLLVKNQDEKESATKVYPGVSILMQWDPNGNVPC